MTYQDIVSDLESSISEKCKSLELVKKAKADVDSGDFEGACIKLHDAICDSSHSDQCGWMYEVKNDIHLWDCPSHKSWMARTKAIFNI